MRAFGALALLFSLSCFSQNLVLNPSFEETERCAEIIGGFNKNAKFWSTPTLGTTDLFNGCSNASVGMPNNFNGSQSAKSGNNYAGLYMLSENNYREYIQGTLASPLEKGVKYTISFYLSLAEKSDFAIKNLGFLLTEEILNTTISKEISAHKLHKLNIVNYSFYSFENRKFYKNNSDWTLVAMDFEAKGNEQFVTIGNFQNNRKTKKRLVAGKSEYDMAYYYLDMVSIKPSSSLDKVAMPTTPPRLKEDEKVEKPTAKIFDLNKTYIFENVIFNFNSTELSKLAQAEIEAVYAFLKQNPSARIFIAGHTDNVGTPDYNQKLSQNRAFAVLDYFKTLGLSNNKISAKGYGATQPLKSNETEEGRAQNRRVAFKIIQE